MGMMLYDALVLAKVAAQLPRRDSVLTLGVPTLNFRYQDFKLQAQKRNVLDVRDQGHIGEFHDHKGFFHNLGFKAISSLDISAYEGADIVEDLNNPDIAERIGKRYDLIYDSGTVEHIFDAPVALRTINRLTEVGGAVVHISPANGFMDHGFWQISPDLLISFYRSAGFKVLTTSLLILGTRIHSVPVAENYYRTKGRPFIAKNLSEALLVFAAQKIHEVSHVQVHLQDYYAQMHQGESEQSHMVFFIPYSFGSSRSRWFSRPIGIVRGVLRSLRAVFRRLAKVRRAAANR
jgi:hypothetical protein